MNNDNNVDVMRIRKCELIKIDGVDMIQFIAIGDRHKMMKMNDGTIEIITLPEQGLDYNYGKPVDVEQAIQILNTGTHNQRYIASQIKNHLFNQTRNSIPVAF